MPSEEYYIEVDNQTVASFDAVSSTAYGLQFGSTEVKLKSQSILFHLMMLSNLADVCSNEKAVVTFQDLLNCVGR